MSDGLKRAADYANDLLAPFLRDVTRGGSWETTERYLILAQSDKAFTRADLDQWVEEFAQRHGLIFEHDKKRESYKFIRAKF